MAAVWSFLRYVNNNNKKISSSNIWRQRQTKTGIPSRLAWWTSRFTAAVHTSMGKDLRENEWLQADASLWSPPPHKNCVPGAPCVIGRQHHWRKSSLVSSDLLIALVGRPWTFCHFLSFVGLINFISFPRLLTFPLFLGNIFFIYIFWTLFYVLVFYLEVWLCAMYVSGNCRGQKRALAPLDLIVSHHMDTGFEPGSFARTNHLTHWATSPAQGRNVLREKQLHNSDKTKIILKVKSWTYKLVEVKSWR